MAGIASDRNAVNPGSLAIPSVNPAPLTPAIAQLQQAYQQGIVTVQDLVKRGFEIPAEAEKNRQNLQDERVIRPLAREAKAGELASEIAIQPKKRELAEGQLRQGIRALPTPGEEEASDAERAKSAQVRNALVSSIPGVREKTIAKLSNDQVVDLWTAAHGQPPPEQLQVPDPDAASNTPAPIDEWFINQGGVHPPGSDALATLNSPKVQQAYNAYVREVKTRPLTLFKDDPKYLDALREDLKQTDLKNAIQAAQIKALPGVLEQQSKVAAEAPTRESKARDNLITQVHQSKDLESFRLRGDAVTQIRDLTRKPNPSNQDDLGLIYATVRALDPVSAVREGEISLLQKGIGLPNELVIQFNRLRGSPNAVLTPEIRQGFASLAETQMQSASSSVRPELQRIAGLAQKDGVPLTDVLNARQIEALGTGTPGAAPAGTAASVQVGDIVTLKDGRRIRVKQVTATGIIPDETFVQ